MKSKTKKGISHAGGNRRRESYFAHVVWDGSESKMVYALVTLFNPANDDIKNLKFLAEQVDKLFICDNGENDNRNAVRNMEESRYKYYYNNENLGLSKAFNVVLKDKTNNFHEDDFIFFFDQDTRIGKDHVSKMIDVYHKIEEIYSNIGVLGTLYSNSEGKVDVHRMKKKIIDGCYEVRNVITSSMLMKYGVLESIGFWNEDIFLDLADFDLCWRLGHKGYRCIVTSKSIINHTLGNGKRGFVFHKTWGSEAPIRDYYQTRDGLLLFNKNYVPMLGKMRIALNIFVRPIVYCLFQDDRQIRIKYILSGIKDFATNGKSRSSWKSM